MHNSGEIQSRMKSIRQTVQISNAQKLIAASRIGKAKRMLQEAEPYHARIIKAIACVLAYRPEAMSHFQTELNGQEHKRGALIITSDRGLAGGYNSNLVRTAAQSFRERPPERIYAIGQVGRNQLTRDGFELAPAFDLTFDPPTMFAAREVAERIAKDVESGAYASFDIIYMRYYSTVRLQPVVARVFPLVAADFEGVRVSGEMSFEPDPQSVMSVLMPKYVKGFLYGCLVHAWASELASRVMAMDSAIRNGNEMLDALSLEFNRARQAAITQEITEIVAGSLSMRRKNVFLMPRG